MVIQTLKKTRAETELFFPCWTAKRKLGSFSARVEHKTVQSTYKFAAVAIGRNEGERLHECLQSLSAAAAVVYVDSGSTDGSVQRARGLGAQVLELDMSVPFTAARARNAGYRHLREVEPNLPYVQFIDGDCTMELRWPENALAYLASHPEVAAVCGQLRERYPDASIYNWLCSIEWSRPTGEVEACGGNVMMRTGILESVGGYRNDFIAGEDTELCLRLRAAGWRIWQLDTEMAFHDAGMTRFRQWWRRSVRTGYFYAQGASLHGAQPWRFYVWESRRAWLWGLLLPLACLTISTVCWPMGLAAWLAYPLQVLRQTLLRSGPPNERATLAFFQTLSRFPEVLGQMKFARDRYFDRAPRLIEYK